MTFLVISRRVGERVKVADTMLTLRHCSNRNGYAKLTDELGLMYHLHNGHAVEIAPGVTVRLCSVNGRQCKLGFEAPQDVAIVREGLLK